MVLHGFLAVKIQGNCKCSPFFFFFFWSGGRYRTVNGIKLMQDREGLSSRLATDIHACHWKMDSIISKSQRLVLRLILVFETEALDCQRLFLPTGCSKLRVTIEVSFFYPS